MKRLVLLMLLLGCTSLPPQQEKPQPQPKPIKLICPSGWGHGVPISRNLILTAEHIGNNALLAEVGKHKLPVIVVGKYLTPGEMESVYILQVVNPILDYYQIGRGNPYWVDTPRGRIDWRDYMPKAGDSGCPVLNKQGEVVGIVSGVGQKFGLGVLVVQKPIIISVREP